MSGKRKWLVAVVACVAALSCNQGRTQGPLIRTEMDSSAAAHRPNLQDGQAATLLSDGSWLLTGGIRSNTVSAEMSMTAGQAAPPSTGVVSQLMYARYGHTATVLPDGTVAIIGGKGESGQLVAAVEVFDPTSGENRLIGDSGLTPRTQHTATVLPDGQVLIAGGLGSDGQFLSSAQLWDPQSGAVKSFADGSVAARAGSHAVLLPNGDVALSGGLDARGQSVSTVDLYDPHAQMFSSVSSPEDRRLAAAHSIAAPTIATVIPAADTRDVAVDARLAILLSTPAQTGSSIAQSVSVVGPAGAVAGHVVAAEGGRLLFFTPQIDLLPHATYTVFVRSITDRTGRSFPFKASSFVTQGFDGGASAAAATPTAGQAATVKTAASVSTATIASKAVSSTNTPAPALKPKPASPDDDGTGEDWLPQAGNRHGQWRVLGLKGDPVLNTTAALAAAALTAPSGHTAIIGRVLRYHGRPLQGVTISAAGQTTVTDASGRFLLDGVSAGVTQLEVDGTTAAIGGRHYTKHFIRVLAVQGKTTTVPNPVYLPRVDPATEVNISSPAAAEIVLTHPGIPGLEVHIPKGAVIREPNGNIVTKLSITPIPLDRPPYPTPASFSVYFTLQPGGAYLDASSNKAIRVIYPNYLGLRAGTRANFWNYDPQMGWQVYGQGTVSADGKQVVPDADVGFRKIISFGMGLSKTGNAPATAKPVGQNCGAADPVDCPTGLFIHTNTDLAINDTIPIAVTRTYRQNDTTSRAFGIGSNLSYSMFLDNETGSTFPSQVNLILSDGGRVTYVLQSGTSLGTGVWTHTATPSIYYGSVLAAYNNSSGEGFTITLRDKTVLKFASDPPNELVGITDRFGNALTFQVSGTQVRRVTSPNGRFVVFDYDSLSRIIRATDSIGRVVNYNYDSAGRLQSETDPLGKSESYTYDTSHRMLTVTDRRGHLVTTNVYGTDDGRVTQQTLADGAVWKFGYTQDSSGNSLTTITDPNGSIRKETFNSDGYLINMVSAFGAPEQQTTTLSRDGANLLLTSTDQLGRTTKLAYDGFGNVSSMTRLSGTSGAVTDSYVYEPIFQNVINYTDPLGHSMSFLYDYLGNLTSAADALGNVTRFSHDYQGKLTSVTNPLNKITQVNYNQGDLGSIIDPLGRVTSFLFDSLGRQVGVSDAMGHNQRYEFDVLNRVVHETDAVGGVTSLTYDENGNVSSIQDARNTAPHTYTYDSRNRPHTYTDPNGHTETYNYDGMGNLLSKVDRNNRTTSYTYDGLNRPKTISFADGSVITLTWDAGDRLTQVADTTNGLMTRKFDLLDRLIQEVSPQGQVDYQYDAAGRRSQMTVNGSNPILYQYDNANRLTQISRGSVVVGLQYDSVGRRQSITYPNGIVGTATYDDADQLLALTYDQGATHIGDLAYGYDAAGRRTTQSGSLSRLTVPATVNSATYDPANRLTLWGSQSLTYDNNGNLLTAGTSSYSWNVRNQLMSVSDGGAGFTYDSTGRRSSRTVSGLTTPYLYDGMNAATVSGNAMIDGLGADDHFAQVAAANVTSYLVDALGSTSAVTDGTGAVAASYTYSPYGDTTASASVNTPFQYTGRENDGDSNLYYYRARYYSPSLSRFISEDPARFAGGINFYRYANGNPVSYNDPNGEWVNVVAGAVIGAVGNLTYQLWKNNWQFRCVDPWQVGKWAALGAMAGVLVPEGLIARGGFQTVTHWPGGAGLQAGDWVMTGGNSLRNWVMGGIPELGYALDDAITTEVSSDALSFPEGWEWVKGLLGQRIYTP